MLIETTEKRADLETVSHTPSYKLQNKVNNNVIVMRKHPWTRCLDCTKVQFLKHFELLFTQVQHSLTSLTPANLSLFISFA